MSANVSKGRKAYRQGELLFVPVDSNELKDLQFDPEDARYYSWSRMATNIIREGEATGHKHEIIEQTPETAGMHAPARSFLRGLSGMDMIGAEDRLLAVKEPVEVVHPEHHPLNLPSGIYLIIVQREYDEAKSRRILD
jgi:hypothetical protein